MKLNKLYKNSILSVRGYTKDRTTFEVQRTLNRIAVGELRMPCRKRMLENSSLPHSMCRTGVVCVCARIKWAGIEYGAEYIYSNSCVRVIISARRQLCTFEYSVRDDSIFFSFLVNHLKYFFEWNIFVLVFGDIICEVLQFDGKQWRRLYRCQLFFFLIWKFHSHIFLSTQSLWQLNVRSTLYSKSCGSHIQPKRQPAVAYGKTCMGIVGAHECAAKRQRAFIVHLFRGGYNSCVWFVCTLASAYLYSLLCATRKI